MFGLCVDNDPMNLTAPLKARARDLGFDLITIAPVGPSPDHERYVRWLEAGYAGEMGYLAKHTDLKVDPRLLLPEAKSVVLVGLNYAQPLDPALHADPSRGQIASYALGDDYHRMMRKTLIELDGWLRGQVGRGTYGRVFVDSAPMLERSWAMHAGMGFIGKNTCLINPGIGSWLFLGGILVPEVLDYDEPPAKKGTKRGQNQQSTVNNQQSTKNEIHSTQCPFHSGALEMVRREPAATALAAWMCAPPMLWSRPLNWMPAAAFLT